MSGVPKGPKTTEKIGVTLPIGSLSLLDQLVAKKALGESRAEIAKHLLIAALDAMVERKRIKDVGAPSSEE